MVICDVEVKKQKGDKIKNAAKAQRISPRRTRVETIVAIELAES